MCARAFFYVAPKRTFSVRLTEGGRERERQTEGEATADEERQVSHKFQFIVKHNNNHS